MAKKKKKNRALPQTVGINISGVETHAHLDLEDFREDLPEVMARAKECGIGKIGNIFLGPKAYEANKGLFDDYPEVFFSLGIHPNNSDSCSDEDLEAMLRAFQSDKRLKAVGEIGLDFYWDRVPYDVQEDVFRKQLSLAQDLDLPVVIHSRDAHERTLEVLEDFGWSGRPLLWHCFGSDAETAQRILEHGWYISIPGPVTYKKNVEAQEAVKSIPVERLVLETDCPFLSPEPWRGKRNEPAFIVFTAAKVAELKGMDVNELWGRCAENAHKFFNLSV
ncbi:TatD family hydrolase [Maridesulfovibrio hydrothermalis]|uniref:Hydrolase, TatD family n=1 Tax=Maridesulfovibrio hydrothermalis AM13 = DSM 14728 TaxID=1121451 RepID=L0RAQ7_9BACT|nr:TatD family hydrolase [Maridesulfovibrio hydrothermalis]CCO23302.1 Hydrolase, TatD family [Maridesulfovibrio hydrothermalis AM13 = DSM 14728]